jgi:predicted esterase
MQEQLDLWTILGILLGVGSLCGVWMYYFLRVQKYEPTMSSRKNALSSGYRVPTAAGQHDLDQHYDFELVNPTFGEPHEYTLFWLHGLGDVPSSWKEGTYSFHLKRTKIILPAAPIMPVTLNSGMNMPAWFDINGLSIGAQEDEIGIQAACTQLARMIEHEISEHDLNPLHVAVGGFSQGGALALHTCLVEGYLQVQIGAVVGLSCWLPLGSNMMAKMHGNSPDSSSNIQLSKVNSTTPLFMGHGLDDPLVRLDYGETTFNVLIRNKSLFKRYRMTHETCTSELKDVGIFLKDVWNM